MPQTFTFGTLALAAALTGAGGFALGRFTSPEVATAPSSPLPPRPVAAQDEQPALPNDHPKIDPQSAPPPLPPADPSAPRALAWQKPAAWSDAPNASSMRLATYKIPVATGDKAAPELTVMQAGGSLDANVQRWAEQFGDEGKASLKRETRKLAGYDVTVVSTHGAYGGMSGDKTSEPYELLAAIVQTPDLPFFFKMTGPLKSVEAARKDFDALLASFKKP